MSYTTNYTDENGRIVVKFTEKFMINMVSREGAPEALRTALSLCLGRKVMAEEILLEVESSDPQIDSLLDLILEAAEE